MFLNHSKKLSEIMEHVETGISVHGHYKQGEHKKRVYVGGDYADLRNKVGEKLQQTLGDEYEVIYDPNKIPKDLSGTSKDRGTSINNFINKIGEEGGVQIELPEELRKNVGDALAEIVRESYHPQEERKKKEKKYQIADYNSES
jgi:phage replication-related protein YjqB (UPF0714/DUF867 family)